MLHVSFKVIELWVLKKNIYLKVLSYMGMSAILVKYFLAMQVKHNKGIMSVHVSGAYD